MSVVGGRVIPVGTRGMVFTSPAAQEQWDRRCASAERAMETIRALMAQELAEAGSRFLGVRTLIPRPEYL